MAVSGLERNSRRNRDRYHPTSLHRIGGNPRGTKSYIEDLPVNAIIPTGIIILNPNSSRLTNTGIPTSTSNSSDKGARNISDPFAGQLAWEEKVELNRAIKERLTQERDRVLFDGRMEVTKAKIRRGVSEVLSKVIPDPTRIRANVIQNVIQDEHVVARTFYRNLDAAVTVFDRNRKRRAEELRLTLLNLARTLEEVILNPDPAVRRLAPILVITVAGCASGAGIGGEQKNPNADSQNNLPVIAAEISKNIIAKNPRIPSFAKTAVAPLIDKAFGVNSGADATPSSSPTSALKAEPTPVFVQEVYLTTDSQGHTIKPTEDLIRRLPQLKSDILTKQLSGSMLRHPELFTKPPNTYGVVEHDVLMSDGNSLDHIAYLITDKPTQISTEISGGTVKIKISPDSSLFYWTSNNPDKPIRINLPQGTKRDSIVFDAERNQLIVEVVDSSGKSVKRVIPLTGSGAGEMIALSTPTPLPTETPTATATPWWTSENIADKDNGINAWIESVKFADGVSIADITYYKQAFQQLRFVKNTHEFPAWAEFTFDINFPLRFLKYVQRITVDRSKPPHSGYGPGDYSINLNPDNIKYKKFSRETLQIVDAATLMKEAAYNTWWKERTRIERGDVDSYIDWATTWFFIGSLQDILEANGGENWVVNGQQVGKEVRIIINDYINLLEDKATQMGWKK